MGGKVYTAFFISMAFFSGCVSTSDTMQRWVGATRSELVAEWGEPDRVEPIMPDGEILVYIKRDFHMSRGGDDSNLYGSGTREADVAGRPMRWERRYMFYVNKEDVIHDWKLEKEEAPFFRTEGK